jgi:hypothetical protein
MIPSNSDVLGAYYPERDNGVIGTPPMAHVVPSGIALLARLRSLDSYRRLAFDGRAFAS